MGRVRDPKGEPVVAAVVQAFRRAYRDGRFVALLAQQALSNDLGEYRLTGLQPGTYFVKATSPRIEDAHIQLQTLSPGGAQLFRSIGGSSIPAPDNTTYYPNSQKFQLAVPVLVKPGETAGGIDVILEPPKDIRRIRGSVMLSSGILQNVTLRLIPREPGAPDPGLGYSTSSGIFDIPAAPGAYYLVANVSLNGSIRDLPPGSTAVQPSGFVPVDVLEKDISNLQVSVSGLTISGKVIIEGSRSQPTAPAVRFISGEPDYQSAFVRTADDGTFTVSGLSAREYSVIPGYPGYLKSIRNGPERADDSGVIRPSLASNQVEIVISTNVGRLSGSVIDAKRDLVSSAVVVLLPELSRRSRRDLIRTALSDGDGHFELTQIAPGSYMVFAWKRVERGAWEDPTFMRAYETRGTSVRVEVGGAILPEVRLIQD
jgi:hypothetical protein